MSYDDLYQISSKWLAQQLTNYQSQHPDGVEFELFRIPEPIRVSQDGSELSLTMARIDTKIYTGINLIVKQDLSTGMIVLSITSVYCDADRRPIHLKVKLGKIEDLHPGLPFSKKVLDFINQNLFPAES